MRLEAHRVFAHQRLEPLEPYFRFFGFRYAAGSSARVNGSVTIGNFGSDEQKIGLKQQDRLRPITY